MGTDIEVKDRLVNTKETFLNHENQHESNVSTLTLEDAFRSTKNNRAPKLAIAIGLVVIILMLVSTLFHYYMRTLEDSVQIDIAEFEDVRLKQALFSLGNTSSQLDMLKSALKELETDYRLTLSELQREFDRREKLARLRGEHLKLEQIEMARKISVAHLESEWIKSKKSREKEITALEKRHSEAQLNLGNKADVLNPELKLQSLKIQKVQEHYEARIDQIRQDFQAEKQALILKYNPELSEGELQDILNNTPNSTGNVSFSDEQIQSLITQGGVDNNLLLNIAERNQTQAQVVKELRAIPFVNMPQVAMERLDDVNQYAASGYIELTDALLLALQSKGGEVASYEYMMNAMVARAKSDGLIIDPRDEQDVVVYLRNGLLAKKGDKFDLYRYETALNTRLVVHQENGLLRMRKESSSAAFELLPFDKLVLVKP